MGEPVISTVYKEISMYLGCRFLPIRVPIPTPIRGSLQMIDLDHGGKPHLPRHCSKTTGFTQPVPDGVRREFDDGLRHRLHATYPAPDAHGSALASAPGRPSFASCDSAGCPALPHSMSTAVTCRPETSGLSPALGKRVS